MMLFRVVPPATLHAECGWALADQEAECDITGLGREQEPDELAWGGPIPTGDTVREQLVAHRTHNVN
jgi:hypothetical protein